MRLNAWLARAGVASRRGADDLIKAGRVTVNGERGELNTFVATRDRVEYLFGDSVATLNDDGQGVDVTFVHIEPRRFDLSSPGLKTRRWREPASAD